MTKHDYNNQTGSGLIAILVAITIIAAIFFGSSYFSSDKKSGVEGFEDADVATPMGQVKVKNQAESEIDRLNQITKDRNQEMLDRIE